jgi:tape measure domain-containing protein
LWEITELIRFGADLQSITGHADAAQRSINAITKIKSTGRLQGDELMMLAEAGVSLDLIYGELEKSLGKTRKEVLKAQSAGEISADVAVDAIKRAILHKVGIDEAGKAGKAFANTTLTGLFQQLQAAPKQFALDVADYINVEPLKDAVRAVLAAFNGADKAAIGGFVQQILTGLVKLVPVAIEFAKGFGSSLGAITDALSFGEMDMMEYARNAGVSLGEFFAGAIKLSKKLIEVVPKALGGFFAGLDSGGIMKSLENADWKQIGSDIAVVARAIGALVGGVAKLVRVLGVGEGIAPNIERTSADNVRKKDFGGLGGWLLNDLLGVETYERVAAPAEQNQTSARGPEFQATGWNFYVSGGEETRKATRDGVVDALEAFGMRNVSHAP